MFGVIGSSVMRGVEGGGEGILIRYFVSTLMNINYRLQLLLEQCLSLFDVRCFGFILIGIGTFSVHLYALPEMSSRYRIA